MTYVSITLSSKYDSDALKYYSLGSQSFSLDQYGPEYVITLASDITKEYEKIQNNEGKYQQNDLQQLVLKILPQIFQTGDDIIAVDLLIDCELIHHVSNYVNQNNYQRIVLYLIRMVDYLNTKEEQHVLYNIILNICMNNQDTI